MASAVTKVTKKDLEADNEQLTTQVKKLTEDITHAQDDASDYYNAFLEEAETNARLTTSLDETNNRLRFILDDNAILGRINADLHDQIGKLAEEIEGREAQISYLLRVLQTIGSYYGTDADIQRKFAQVACLEVEV